MIKKYCIDCKWCRKNDLYPFTYQNAHECTNPKTLSIVNKAPQPCKTERANGQCGKAGLLWEKKEEIK